MCGSARLVRYAYWFDVVAPRPGTLVLAEYDLRPTEAGRRVLDAAGLPARFPALLQREEGPSRRFYFAGDWADYARVPPIVRVRGWEYVGRLTSLIAGEDARMFWSVYVPLLRTIAAEQAARVRAAQ